MLIVETGVGSTLGTTGNGTDESSAGSGSKGPGRGGVSIICLVLRVEIGVGSTLGTTGRGADELSAGSGSKGLGAPVGSWSSGEGRTAGWRSSVLASVGLREGMSVASGRGSTMDRGCTSGVGVARGGVSTICLGLGEEEEAAAWACWRKLEDANTASRKLAVNDCR